MSARSGGEPRWLYPLLLALPFLAGVAVLKGLTVEIDTFHGSDARVYHLPTIMRFADELPGVDLGSYPAAQTPLFHLLFAAWGKLVGFELWRLRLLNVAVSYAAVLVLFRLLVQGLGLRRPHAFALSLLFALSPYFFGASFTLLTDNLALLFGLVALERFLRASRSESLGPFALGALAMGAAVLTRQSFAWLVVPAAWALLRGPATPRRKLAGAALAALSLAPFAALVADWGALVPPGSDPASCGLCAEKPGTGRDTLTLRTVAFTLALVGLYAAAVWWPVLLRRARELRPRVLDLALPAGAGVLLLAISPLLYRPVVPGAGGDAGYLWRLSDRLPELAGSSLLFWGLAPLGLLAAWQLGRRAGPWSLPVAYLAAFLVSVLPVRLVYQKYFDPFALLAVVLLAKPGDLRVPWDYAGVALAGAAFVAYAVSFAG